MFVLDFRSRVPIYEQLVEKFKTLIIGGVLKPDEQLPSVRILAGQVTVNPNTIQKAYRELEQQDYIYSLPGKGHFVMPISPEKHTGRREMLTAHLTQIVAEMLYLGIDLQDIIDIIHRIASDEKGGQHKDD
ncbi:MAG: GntR family transcriptional regulator [Syntrophomonadaceae bacterium]|nr:GntR family transcriptional regulator [Syntrophomonadaceae bacterium]